MAKFYVTQNGLLTRWGSTTDGHEGLGLLDGEELALGEPPGYDGSAPPYPGMAWHVQSQSWADNRSTAERQMHESEDFARTRRAAYPPLADLADALYWQSQGDDTKMLAYMAAVAAVKAQFPKSN